MGLFIIPECYVDTNLIETIAPSSIPYNHQKGCGTVAKVMKERFVDRFAIGIIDKDKKELDYLNDFTIIQNAGNLILHKHRQKPHYIIQISPAIEAFILNNAAATGINLADFDLPINIDKLKKEAKSTTSKTDQRFKNLFRALLAKNAADILKLKRWIDYLKENTYKADEQQLKTL